MVDWEDGRKEGCYAGRKGGRKDGRLGGWEEGVSSVQGMTQPLEVFVAEIAPVLKQPRLLLGFG